MTPSLEELQDEILDRVHAGEAIDEAAVLAAHPEHAADLGAFFQVIALVEGSVDDTGLPPANLGEFRVLREIGRGGMGVVYEAEQTSLKRRVALKVLPPLLRMDTRLLARFRREAEAAGRLRHAGIVPVFAVGEAAGAPFFAMELVEGTTLQKVLAARKEGKETELVPGAKDWQPWAVETIARVADALGYAHGEGILHRDVKPANILLGADGAPRLTDFGLAQDLRSPGLTQTGEVFGSPQYMSPEQAVRRAAPVDERTDVYSLAVTLYELLTLRLPYDGTTNAELLTALAAGRVIPPRKANPEIPRALEGVLLRALRTDPHDRYRNAAAFAADLRAALAGAPTDSREPLLAGKGTRILVGAAAVVLVALAAWWAYPDPRSGDDGTTGRQPSPPTHRGETAARGDAAGAVDEILATYRLASPRKEADYRTAIAGLEAIDTSVAKLALKGIYEDFIAGPGKDDPQARAALGYVEFAHEVPEVIARRRYGYVRAVEKAREQRWFPPDDGKDYELALRAWAETEAHALRLETDPRARASDAALSAMVNDAALAKHTIAVRQAGPFVLCYSSSEMVAEYDTFALEGPWRSEARLRAAKREKHVQAILAEYALVLEQVHQEFVRRYGEELQLKPLTEPYGGRPDYPVTVRSYQEGCPLLVWIFDGRASFAAYHQEVLGDVVPRSVAGYFDPPRGALLLHAGQTEDTERALALRKCAQEAVHQLVYWFTRQRNRWRKLRPSQDWFAVGLGEYLGAVELHEDGKLRFRGVDPARLKGMQTLAQALKKQGKPYPVFPIERLVAFQNFGEVQQWAVSTWQLSPAVVMSLFYQQAWALTHHLNEGEGGKHRGGYGRLLDLRMRREPGPQAFLEAFRIRSAHGDGWTELNEAFQKQVGQLLKLDPKDYEHAPPALGSLPGK